MHPHDFMRKEDSYNRTPSGRKYSALLDEMPGWSHQTAECLQGPHAVLGARAAPGNDTCVPGPHSHCSLTT